MRFIVDECTGQKVAKWLEEEGHDVYSVYDQSRGVSDEMIIELANANNRILITNDKDFGEKIFKEKYPHKGVIFLRIQDERSGNKIQILRSLFQQFSDRLSNNFVVVTEDKIRFAKV